MHSSLIAGSGDGRRASSARNTKGARLAVAGVLASLAVFPAAADAALTVQPNAPQLGFPASVTDASSGISLMSCQDTSGFCVETPAPNPTQPLSVPGNYTPDGEAFYQLADATVPNAGIGLARFALEQAFTTADPTAGQQIMFGRIRFRFGGLKPGTKYRVTHPFGVDEVIADGSGIVNQTEDLGCLGPPCDFAAANYGRISAFLQWDPTVAPAAPTGYVGNFAVPHAVIGSPAGTNFVRLEELTAGGLVAATVGETSQFLVQGKLAGAAPAPAPFAIADATALDYASRQVGTTTPAKNVMLSNHGTANLTVTAATIGGADAADFQVASNGCAGAVAPGSSCPIAVTFAPQATGTRRATLSITSNAGPPQTIALMGVGTPATLPAPAPVVIQAPAPAPIVVQAPAPTAVKAAPPRVGALRVERRVSTRTARGRGITATFSAPAGVSVARLRLIRVGARTATATKLVVLTAPGRQTIHLRAKRARPGRYRLEVSVGTDASALSARATTLVTLSR